MDETDLKKVHEKYHGGSIKKYERPSLIRKKAYIQAKKELIDYIVKNQEVTKARAAKIVESDEIFQEVLAMKDKKARLEMMDEVMPRIKEAVLLKTERGSMEQAQKGMTAWAIARDKAVGEEKRSGFQIPIAGKNVQVNVGFKFRPYKKK